MLLALACADPPVPEPPSCASAAEPDGEIVTTRARIVVPGERLEVATDLNPAFPEGLAAAEELGLGEWTEGPGEDWHLRDDLVPGWSPPAGRVSLAMFVHESDAQLADAESPTRVAAGDRPGETQAAARPQEIYAIHALDALVRATNALHEAVGIDFWLATGDNADSVQENETRWFVDTLDGTPVTPDSGQPDTQRDASCNDPLAAFTPAGLDLPWYAVAGNHDVLVQGNFAPEAFRDMAVQSDAPWGTRDLSLPGGPLAWDTVPDAARRLLDRADIAALYMDSPGGHGFTDRNVQEGTVGWVARPVPGLTLIALDANPEGVGDGALSTHERDTFLVPALEAAGEDLVIVTSHYALGDLRMEGGGRLADLLTQYENVVLTVAGHSHVNRVAAYGSGAAAFWEIQTSSTVDWPGQGRLVELVVNGDGTLSTIVTMFDYPAPAGSLAAEARRLTLIDWQSGWRGEAGAGEAGDRNVELVQLLPEGWAATGTSVRSHQLP